MIELQKGIPLIDQHNELGYWGGKFGGTHVAESLIYPIEELTKEFEKLRYDEKFLAERDFYFKNFVGAPTPFIKLDNLTKHLGGAQIYCKLVSKATGGAHKAYNAVVHALIAKHLGKSYIGGDTGAGYAGKMLSMVSAKFNLKAKIFMGAKDIERQKINVFSMKSYGAEVVPVTTGSQTLVDAVSESMRWWTAENEVSHLCVGSTVGPTIFVKICAWSTAQISREMKKQVLDEFGEIPKDMKLINCVGGGSSAAGFWNEWMDDSNVELIGVEAGGPEGSSKHAAPLTNDSPLGVLHGATQYVIQDDQGEIEETESISAGLDYPGVSPLHCFLKETGRARYTSATDEEAIEAFQLVSRMEGFVSPSLEPSHAFAEAIKIAPSLSKDTVICVDSCGDSAKDAQIIAERLGYEL
mgnify:FL=1|tara:strand:+ start:2174 stop:3406 length:1233 start_codon:yes stop_codon:yes gene_type:complete